MACQADRNQKSAFIWKSLIRGNIQQFWDRRQTPAYFLGRFLDQGCYSLLVMATTTKRTRFSRRLPDHVTDELVTVLSEKKVFGFNDLFERVFENLKIRNAVSGGEEMLRLRAYEKLQNLVTRGLVEKIGKEYKGTARVHEASSAYAAAQEAAQEGA
jgi:hypothetical protein